MNIVTLSSDQPVTTTFAIAEGTNNDHASVIKLARTYLVDLEEFGRVGFQIAPFETAGGVQQREIAVLNEQQSTLLMTYMRNNEVVREFKKRLVKEFWAMSQKMRQQSQNPANLSRLQLLEMAIQAEQERMLLENKVEELSPKADALDRIATHSDGSFCVRDAAKTLQIQEKKFRQLLFAEKWLYRRPMGSELLAYSDKLQSGLMEHKITKVDKDDGSERIFTQARITAKGLAKLSKMLAANRPDQLFA